MKRNSILGLVAAMMMISCVGTKDVKYLQKNENLEINSEGLVPYNIPVYRVTKNDILSLREMRHSFILHTMFQEEKVLEQEI